MPYHIVFTTHNYILIVFGYNMCINCTSSYAPTS